MWTVDLIGFVLCLAAVILLAASFSYKYKENMASTIPMAYAALGLSMYVLSIIHALRGIFFVAFEYIVCTAVSFYKEKKKNTVDRRIMSLKESVFSPEILGLVVIGVIIGILTSKLAFSWWDDINFWSQDAKQIFYLNGFAGKYGNVSPEFGDYPPIGSLYKCLFLFAGLGEYRENLQFLGYFMTNTIFMLPLFGVYSKAADKYSGAKKNVLTVFCFAAMVLFPESSTE